MSLVHSVYKIFSLKNSCKNTKQFLNTNPSGSIQEMFIVCKNIFVINRNAKTHFLYENSHDFLNHPRRNKFRNPGKKFPAFSAEGHLRKVEMKYFWSIRIIGGINRPFWGYRPLWGLKKGRSVLKHHQTTF